MRIDPLQQFAKLQQQLTDEKRQLEARLAELNQVLGSASDLPSPSATAQAVTAPRRGRGRGQNALSMREAVLNALSKGPLARKEIVKAVEDLGYVFQTKNPLNSIGSILYGKNTPVKSKDGKYYVTGSSPISVAAGNGGPAAVAQVGKKRRTMSPEGRARIAAAARARWAKVRRAK
jgi:hypothetical protein